MNLDGVLACDDYGGGDDDTTMVAVSTTYVETKKEIQQDRFWKQNTTLSSGLVSMPIPDLPGSNPDVLSLSTYVLSPNPDVPSPNPDVPSPKPAWAWAHMGLDPHGPTPKQTLTQVNALTDTHTHSHTWAHTRMHDYGHMCIDFLRHAYIYICIYIYHRYAHIYVCIHVQMYTYICICIGVYMYRYIRLTYIHAIFGGFGFEFGQ